VASGRKPAHDKTSALCILVHRNIRGHSIYGTTFL
jgi:hypothetical protein